MNRLCNNKLCYFFDPFSPNERVNPVICPYCETIQYCSPKCRD